MPDVRVSEAARDAMANALAARHDIGGAGRLRLYTAPRPATADAAATGTLLAELKLSNPATFAAFAGAVTFAPIEEAPARASGEAAWGRFVAGDGTAVWDVDVGPSGSDAALRLDRVKLLAGGPVRVQAGGTFAIPAG